MKKAKCLILELARRHSELEQFTARSDSESKCRHSELVSESINTDAEINSA